jgi:hypothetical protein
MLVIVARGSQQDDLRPDHFVVRYGVFRGVFKENSLLCIGKRDYERTVT